MKSAVMLLAVLSAQNGGSGEAAAARLRKLYLERWGTTDCKSIQEQNGRRGCDEVIAMTAAMVERIVANLRDMDQPHTACSSDEKDE